MIEEYYVDSSGNFIGTFYGCAPTVAAHKVDIAPTDSRQTWSFTEKKWNDIPAASKAKDAIAELEKQITVRRIREAILGLDKGWLLEVEKQIHGLRLIINS